MSVVSEMARRHLVELKSMQENLKIMALESEVSGLDVFNENIGEHGQPKRNSRLDELQEKLEVEKQERQFLREELARSNELVQIQEQTINDKDQELQQVNKLISQTVDALVKEALALKTVESTGKFWLGLVRDKKKDHDAALKIQSIRRCQLARRKQKEDAEIVELRAKVTELSQLLEKERSCREVLEKQLAKLQAPVAKIQALPCTAPSVASSAVMHQTYTPGPVTPVPRSQSYEPGCGSLIASPGIGEGNTVQAQSTFSAWNRSPQPAKVLVGTQRNCSAAKAGVHVNQSIFRHLSVPSLITNVAWSDERLHGA